MGPYATGEVCEATHMWNESGIYEVKVMAKDTNEGESDWSDPLEISPRSRERSSILFLRLYERFPNIFPIFRYLLGFD
jgi:hypothetical protein